MTTDAEFFEAADTASKAFLKLLESWQAQPLTGNRAVDTFRTRVEETIPVLEALILIIHHGKMYAGQGESHAERATERLAGVMESEAPFNYSAASRALDVIRSLIEKIDDDVAETAIECGVSAEFTAAADALKALHAALVAAYNRKVTA